MQLELKTNCDRCGNRLPTGGETYICSCESTFCAECASRLHVLCPNCGGELTRQASRPILLGGATSGDFEVRAIARPWMIWLVSFGIWIFIAFASAISMYQFDRSLGRSVAFHDELKLPLINYLIYALLTPFVFWTVMRSPIWESNWRRRLLLYVGMAFGFTVIHVMLRGLMYSVWDPRIKGYAYPFWNSATHTPTIQWILLKRLFLYNVVDDIFFYYLPIVLIGHVICYYQRFRARELRSSQLETELVKADLQTLKNQLQPHFLFNTLHSISALMLTDVRAADTMMSRLSELLRMSLEGSRSQMTSVRRELEFVTGYLEIEKVRFEDRLNVTLDVSPETLDAQVPHLLLQPLVENAVRHGISRTSEPGHIRITVTREERMLKLTVADDGPGAAIAGEQLKAGLGLTTTRRRLQGLYGEAQTFEIRSGDDGGFEVRVGIPFGVEPPTMLMNWDRLRAIDNL